MANLPVKLVRKISRIWYNIRDDMRLITMHITAKYLRAKVHAVKGLDVLTLIEIRIG